MHKFNVKNKNKLDNPKRREMLPPDETLIKLGLHKDDVMADIGCGIGYFTIPAAKIIGENGQVFATDISQEMLNEVKIKVKENNISNVKTILTEKNDFKLQAGKITIAFISTVLHEIEDKESFLIGIKKLISPNGRIAIVEWQKIKGEFGPPIEERIDKVELKEGLNRLGFSNISLIDIGGNFYGLVAQI